MREGGSSSFYIESEDRVRERVAFFTNQFTGGDCTVGNPAYQEGEVVAYSPEQAKKIFENLMAARIQAAPIPFLTAGNGEGNCKSRKNMMTRHMMYHQGIHPHAIGVVVAKFLDPKKQNMADYAKRIQKKLNTSADTLLPANYNEGFVSTQFHWHTAPTIRICQDGVLSDLVLDPALCSNPASFKVWANAQKQGLAMYHHRLGSPEKKLIIGEMDKKSLDELSASADDGSTSTLDELSADARDLTYNGQNSLMYQLSYINDACEKMAADTKVQDSIMATAKEQGYGILPNCGPRALQMLNTAKNKRGV